MFKYGSEQGKDYTPMRVESTGGISSVDYILIIQALIFRIPARFQVFGRFFRYFLH